MPEIYAKKIWLVLFFFFPDLFVVLFGWVEVDGGMKAVTKLGSASVCKGVADTGSAQSSAPAVELGSVGCLANRKVHIELTIT